MFAKPGRFGPYVQLGEMADTLREKPKTSSLFKTMDPESITLDDALRLLSLPRVVGSDPGRRRGDHRAERPLRPVPQKGIGQPQPRHEEQLFTVTVDEALRIFAEPKQPGAAGTAPLKELGEDPVSEKPVVVKDGRFGPYVTDGEMNASLRKGDSVETITIERAAELLQDRRDGRPAKKKKAAAKKAAKKKAAKKKAPAKKAAAKKS